MPGATTVGDLAKADADAHGCPACPHPSTGPAILGSPTVFINNMPAIRKDDLGMAAVCCGPNMWTAQMGSTTVNINSKAAVRKDDMTKHCGGTGKTILGSPDVIIGG